MLSRAPYLLDISTTSTWKHRCETFLIDINFAIALSRFLIQSEDKPKPIVIRSHKFSRVAPAHVFGRVLIGLLDWRCPVIGQRDNFDFVTALLLKC